MGTFLQSWAGEASNWECDELGHLNMRYYVAKAAQARQMFIIMTGLPGAFLHGASSTARCKTLHIRYQKEARPGAQLFIETGLLNITDTEIELIHMIYHADGSLAASIRESLQHISRRTQQAFPWPKRVHELVNNYRVNLPEAAQAKGVSLSEPILGATMQELEDWECERIGMGVFSPHESNKFQTVTMEDIMGRASDCVANFRAGWPEAFSKEWRSQNIMGALLEARLTRHQIARPGMAFYVYSGLRSVGDVTREMVHHIVSPVTGASYASMIGVSALMDLKARRLVRLDEKQVAALQMSCKAQIKA